MNMHILVIPNSFLVTLYAKFKECIRDSNLGLLFLGISLLLAQGHLQMNLSHLCKNLWFNSYQRWNASKRLAPIFPWSSSTDIPSLLSAWNPPSIFEMPRGKKKDKTRIFCFSNNFKLHSYYLPKNRRRIFFSFLAPSAFLSSHLSKLTFHAALYI